MVVVVLLLLLNTTRVLPLEVYTTERCSSRIVAQWCTAAPAEHRTVSANMLVQSKQ